MIPAVTANDPNRTPIDQALDLFVYLPVGFVFELPRSIPRFIERGRRELHGDGHTADAVSLFDPVRRLDRAQAHAFGTLRALGVLPRDEAGPGPAGPTGPSAAAVDDDPPPAALASVPGNGAATTVPAVDPDSLAIPGYDSLSASQVMPRLESLSAPELELVRTYEVGNRGRKTILNKIAQLQAG